MNHDNTKQTTSCVIISSFACHSSTKCASTSPFWILLTLPTPLAVTHDNYIRPAPRPRNLTQVAPKLVVRRLQPEVRGEHNNIRFLSRQVPSHCRFKNTDVIRQNINFMINGKDFDDYINHRNLLWCLPSNLKTKTQPYMYWISLDRKPYLGPLLLTWINFNPSMDNNYMPRKVWDEITYPFLNFNGWTVEV